MKEMGPFWLWPNLLSLDAPILAVLWQSFLARCYGIPLRPAARVTLFLAVWAIYIADRLLDVRRPATTAESARHRFYRRHPRFGSWLLAAVLAATATVSLVWLRPSVFRNGMVPLAGALVYLAAINLARTGHPVAKEVVVALVFTTGTFLVAWTNDPVSPGALLPPAMAFCLLCLANLAAIEKWEWEELRRFKEPPHPMTRGLVRVVPAGAPLLAATALVWSRDPWYLAIGLAAAGIAALLFAGQRISHEARRLLVDAALLTPLLFYR